MGPLSFQGPSFEGVGAQLLRLVRDLHSQTPGKALSYPAHH